MKTPARLIVAITLLVCGFMFSIAGWRAYEAHDAVLSGSRVARANIASSLAAEAQATVNSAGIVLSDLIERLTADGTTEPALGRLHRLMIARAAEIQTIHHLVVLSARGSLLTSSFEPMPSVNVADRAFFRFHRDDPDTAALVGPLVQSRSDGRWAVTVSRRFNNPDGTFGGVAVAAIDRDTFSRAFARLDVGAHGSVTLVNDDQVVVVREPALADNGIQFKTSIKEIGGDRLTGSGRLISVVDGLARLYSYERVTASPLTVVVALSEDEVLEGWRRDAWTALAACTLFSAALGFLGCKLFTQLQRRTEGEAVIRRSEEQYRLIAQHSTDVIVRLGADCRRRYVSPASERLLGYLPQELLDGHPKETTHPDDWPVLERNVNEILRIGHAPPVIYRTRRKDGEIVWIEGVGQRLLDGQGFIFTLRDITLRKRAEELLHTSNGRLHLANLKLERLAERLTAARDEAEQSSRAKSRFLAGISHELRTPLNGILGYAHLLELDGDLNPVQAARVKAMLGAGTHLLEMLSRVLDLTEIEADHAELQLSEVDPADVASACIDVIRPTAFAKQLVLAFIKAPNVPQRFTTDPTRLRQVLLNLLGNAVKFTSVGSVELRVLLSPSGTMLRFEVADTGPGIPNTSRNRLFQEFERLGAELDATVEGSGLGLALSARLASLMEGRLCYESNPAGGSIFWLELPYVAEKSGDAAVVLPLTTPIAAEPIQARQLRILVVDDLAMNRDIAGSFLRAAGHKVVCAEGGAEAIAAAGAGDFELILMDVRMPEIDGLEATRRVRALPGLRGQVPIIALTAQAFTEQIDECLRAGMNSHLAKPFTPLALVEAVESAVDANRTTRSPLKALDATRV